jgi:guanylate kinase
MLVLSSPSGAGKTTISRELLKREPSLVMSVSATTRAKRPGEVEGRDYFFKTVAEFEAMARRGEFLEHARVFDNLYGTPRAAVDAALRDGRDVLFDVDWQGTQKLKESARADLASVFILPPSMTELEHRLRTRAQDAEDVVRSRMARAAAEMSHWAEYDYIVVNSDVETSVARVQAILTAERLKRDRQSGLADFVGDMCGEK